MLRLDDWIIVRAKTAIRADGTPTRNTRDAHEVEVQFNNPKPPPDSHVFHLFPKLPPELRRHIWVFALPAPRILELWDTNNYRDPVQRETDGAYSGAPSFLLACKEAHEVYLRHYSKIDLYGQGFGSPADALPFHLVPSHQAIGTQGVSTLEYVDFARDSIRISETLRTQMRELGRRLDLSRIEHLVTGWSWANWHVALNPPRLSYYQSQFEEIEKFARLCPRLRTLTIVDDQVGIWRGRGDRDTATRLVRVERPFRDLELCDTEVWEWARGEFCFYWDYDYRRSWNVSWGLEEGVDWMEFDWESIGRFADASAATAAEETPGQSAIDIKMGVICKEIDRLELVHLVPRIPRYYGVTYFGYKQRNDPEMPWGRIEDLGDVPLRPDGTFGEKYDGIPGLFGDE